MKPIAEFEPGHAIRWGILGCGDVTEVKSGPALQKAEGSSLTAVMRRQGQLAHDYAQRHHVPLWFDDAQELIEHPEVDAVYVAAPPGAHLELALQVCAAGKPCYVEKPMARSAAESQLMLQSFQGAGVPLFVAFYRRALPRFVRVREMLRQGELGQLTSVSYTLASPGQSTGELPWRLRAEDAGAGLFYDLGSHLLDLLDHLLGPLTLKGGWAANRGGHYAVEDGVSLAFKANGLPGVAQWDFATSFHQDRLVVCGSKGRLELSCFGFEPVAFHGPQGTRSWEDPVPQHVHQPLVQTMVDQLHGSGQCPSTGTSALRTMQLMDEVLAPYYGGRDDAFWLRPETWPGRGHATTIQPTNK